MASKAFTDITAGLESALAYAKGDKSQGVEHRVRIDEPVKTARHPDIDVLVKTAARSAKPRRVRRGSRSP